MTHRPHWLRCLGIVGPARRAQRLRSFESLESAIYITLDPGAYTAIVSGVNGGTGVGLVEVYKAP